VVSGWYKEVGVRVSDSIPFLIDRGFLPALKAITGFLHVALSPVTFAHFLGGQIGVS